MNSFLAFRMLHMTCAALSLAGFVTRGILRAVKPDLLQARVARVLPHVVDTVLLLSALRLVSLVGFAANASWLLPKIGGVVVYVLLGSIALKYGKRRWICAASWVGAIAVFAFIVSVARTHQPLGFFEWR